MPPVSRSVLSYVLAVLLSLTSGCTLDWNDKEQTQDAGDESTASSDGGGESNSGGSGGESSGGAGADDAGNASGSDAGGNSGDAGSGGDTGDGGAGSSGAGTTGPGMDCSAETCNGTDDDCDTVVDESCMSTDECAALPCKNGGACTDGDGTFTCACAPGFEGPTCEVNLDECTPNPCQNGGKCTDGSNRFTCSCLPGFQGALCEINNNDCSPNPCRNGGVCKDATNGYMCSCLPGYTGMQCEIDVDECAAKPCQNGGVCKDGVNDFTCSCAAGYAGKKCETNIDECAAKPCLNGGVCKDGVNAYTCTCPAGYVGARCETNVDDCAAMPCKNGGTCKDGVNTYSCLCTPDYTGPHCEFQICSGTTIRSKSELAAYQMCKEVRGNLAIGPSTDIRSIAPSDFPYLTKVSGDLSISGLQRANADGPWTEAIVFDALDTIGGNLVLGGLATTQPKTVRFSALKSVGSGSTAPGVHAIDAMFMDVVAFDFPVLTTIDGSVRIGNMDELCSANFRRVATVSGQVWMASLPNLPASHVQALVAAAPSETVMGVGCCVANDTLGCDSNPLDPSCRCQL